MVVACPRVAALDWVVSSLVVPWQVVSLFDVAASSLLKGILNFGRGARGGFFFDSTGHGDGLRRCVLPDGPVGLSGVDGLL